MVELQKSRIVPLSSRESEEKILTGKKNLICPANNLPGREQMSHLQLPVYFHTLIRGVINLIRTYEGGRVQNKSVRLLKKGGGALAHPSTYGK